MRRATTTVVGLAALLVTVALSAALAGPASASEFLYTGPLPGIILIEQTNNQVFNPEPSHAASEVTCKIFTGKVTVPASAMNSRTVKVNGNYSKCEMIAAGKKVTISEIEYEISANGLVNVLKPVTIFAIDGTCTVKVFSGSEDPANKALEKLLFLNLTDGSVLIHSDTEGIHSFVTGGNEVCGKVGTTLKEGKYIGLVRVFAHNGGTVVWDQ